jgi:acyl-CoA thioester hydrolase
MFGPRPQSKKEKQMAEETFSQDYKVNWENLDPNQHLRGSVMVDYAVNTQFVWLGVSQQRYAELGWAPVASRMEVRYHREATLGDTVKDTPVLTAMSPDGSRWRVRHSFVKNGGEKLGSIVLEGSWLNWRSRKAVAPSQDVLQALNALQRSSDFEELRSLIRENNPKS